MFDLDPDYSNCAADCPELTPNNIEIHVACQLECVHYDYTGLHFNFTVEMTCEDKLLPA